MKKLISRLLLPALLLSAPLALAEEASSGETLEIQFRGTLHDAIEKIAEEGGLNVVVTEALDTPAQLHLRNVTAEQALRTLARAHALKLEHDGTAWVVRSLTAQEKAEQAAAPRAPPPLPLPPPIPPLPAGVIPPLPPDVGAMVDGTLDEHDIKQQMRQKMRKVRRSGKGARDVVARGHSLEVREGESVDSAVVYGGNLMVKGNVERDAVVFGGNLEITGHVEGDAAAFGGNVVLGPDAKVDGDVSAFGGSVQRQDGAKVEGGINSLGGANVGRMVAGEIKKNLKEARHSRADADSDDDERSSGFAFFVLEFAILFGLGFLGQILFPSRMKELGEEIRQRPARSGVVGLLATIALIPALTVLTITIIGIPIALALTLVLPLLTVLGFSAVASELGRKLPLPHGQKTQASVLALGLLVLLAVGQIPVLGTLVLVLAAFVSLGAITRTRFGQRPQGLPEPISRDARIPV